MRKIVGFSAGDRFVQLTLSGGGTVRFDIGDDWDVYASVNEERRAKEKAKSALVNMTELFGRVQQSRLDAEHDATSQAKRANEAEESLRITRRAKEKACDARDYEIARRERAEAALEDTLTSKKQVEAVTNIAVRDRDNMMVAKKLVDVRLAERNHQLEASKLGHEVLRGELAQARALVAETKLRELPERLVDDTTFDKLNGKNVTVVRKTLPGSETLVDRVHRMHVREAIFCELGVMLTPGMIAFQNVSELGVWDAWVSLPGHEMDDDRAQVKVWIVKEEEADPIKPGGCGTCANDTTVCPKRKPNPCEGCEDGSKFAPRKTDVCGTLEALVRAAWDMWNDWENDADYGIQSTIARSLRPLVALIRDLSRAHAVQSEYLARYAEVEHSCDALLGK